MKKSFLLIGFLILMIGSCLAADGWGSSDDFSDESNVSSVSDVQDEVVEVSDVVDYSGDSGSSEKETFFTQNFYIAVGAIVLGLVIVGIFVWLFLRRPKNKWE